MQYKEINPYDGRTLYVPETYFPSRKTLTIDTGYGYAVETAHKQWRLIENATGELRLPPIRGGSIAAAYVCQSTTVFAAPAAVHTFIMAISPAGHGLCSPEWAISFDGVTSSAIPVLVEFVNSTQGAAGTAGVSTVITQIRGRSTTGSAPTMGGNYTGEPTTLVALKRWYIPAFMGTFTYQAPLGREAEADSSGGTIRGLGTRITPPATVNAVGYIEVEALG